MRRKNQTNELPNDSYETRLIDPQIMYSHPFFHSTVRLSLPVTEVSREIGRYELRYNGGGDLVDAGRFTVGYGVEARAYAYTNDDSGERYARYRAIASPVYKVADKLSIISAVIYDVKFHKNGKGFDQRRILMTLTIKKLVVRLIVAQFSISVFRYL